MEKQYKSEQEWQDTLSSHDFYICRQKGTEPAFSGQYYQNKQTGRYLCKCCDLPLFSSLHKYDSGSGWPSFFDALSKEHILEIQDISHGMVRTEITCARCDSHLGHVFPDGPKPTGLRYCVNSASLTFSCDDLNN